MCRLKIWPSADLASHLSVTQNVYFLFSGCQFFLLASHIQITNKKVYPEALSLLPIPNLWCVLFFLMMITIGFGSILSLMECVLDAIIESFKNRFRTESSKILFRLGFITLLFLVGLPMTTRVIK